MWSRVQTVSLSQNPEVRETQVRALEEYVGRVQGLLISLAGTLAGAACTASMSGTYASARPEVRFEDTPVLGIDDPSRT